MKKLIIVTLKVILNLRVVYLILIVSDLANSQHYNYAVVISSEAYSQSDWKTVADSLVRKHEKNGTARLFTWPSSVTEIKDELSGFNPDYIGYIARPVVECNAAFIVSVSRLSRQLDSDPYGDAVWGIITGYEASNALRAISESLTVKTVLAASGNLSYEPPIRRFYQALGMTCDSYTKTDYLFPESEGKVYSENKRPDNEQDRIKLVSKWLNAESMNLEIPGKGSINGPVDCIITGGHGNVNLWQCHYPDAGTEGYMRSSDGKLFGSPYSGGSISINVPTPKIYWCASNCLMGNPDSKDNVVYAAFNTGHAVQMFGFVNNASAGDEFMAWGVYDRVTKSAGTYTLPEVFFLSNNNALFEINNPSGQMNTILIEQYMDSTVFYGDPAGDVKFYDPGDSAKAFKSDITVEQDNSGNASFTFSFTMVAHDLEFGVGYCYQFRPVSLLPVRIDPSSVEITKNEGYKALITDNLLIWEILSRGQKLARGNTKTLQWTAKITDDKTGNRTKTHSPLPLRILPKLTMSAKMSELLVNIKDIPKGNFDMKITDLNGKLCFQGKFNSAGVHEQSFSIGKVNTGSGIRLIQLVQGGLRLNVTSVQQTE
jgi:hypothetical protein